MAAPETNVIRASLTMLGDIEAERLRVLWSGAALGVIAESLAVAALAVPALGRSVDPAILAWVAGMALIQFTRLGFWMQFRTARREGALAEHGEHVAVVVAGAAGLAWGLALPLVAAGASGLWHGVVALVAAAVSILACDTLLASRRAVQAFVLPALLCPALALFAIGSFTGYSSGIALLLFLGALLGAVARRHRDLLDVLSARVQNDLLLAELGTANESLRAAQRDERLVFDAALVGIAIVTEDRFVRCNRKLEEILGYRRGTLNGASTRVLYRSESEWREALEYIQADLAESGRHDAEREFQRRDGTELWCRYRGQALDREDPARGAIWVFEDLSEQRLAADEMLKSEEQLAAADAETRALATRLADAIESVPDAFALFDRHDVLVNCNARYVDYFPDAHSREALIGRTYEEIVVDAVRAGQVPQEYRRNQPAWVEELARRHRNAGGEDFVYQIGDRWVQLRERRTSDGGVVQLRTDITELKRIEEQVRHLAHHDPLTGLPNRRLLEDRLAQAFGLARRNGSQVAVMLVDLDRFKSVNDNRGHEAGDIVLREVAKRLRASVREVDTVARQGGDEFVVVLSELREAAAAERVARKIIAALAKPMTVGKTIVEIGASVGIAIFPGDGRDAATLLAEADSAMYRAKSAGRGCCQFVTQLPVQDELRFD